MVKRVPVKISYENTMYISCSYNAVCFQWMRKQSSVVSKLRLREHGDNFFGISKLYCYQDNR